MAITNSERVGKALDLLKDGLRPFVERELKATYKERWVDTARPSFPNWQQTGTVVRTLWGELAYQLGGREAYEMVRSADEKAVSPGDSLRLLFNKYSPCLILIDEWVSYARQLFNKSDLPSGDFDAHFTFAQTLSESAKLSDKTLLVVSIPASQNEIGGEERDRACRDVLAAGDSGRRV